MRKRSARIEALLGEMMPLAHAVGHVLKHGSEMSRLLTSLYSIMYDRDDEAFQAVLEALRAEGLTELWQYFWDRATDMACAKSYDNGFRSLLIAVPFLAPWSGECRAADRKALSQVLKKQEIIPPRGKVHWFQQPQSIYHLRDTSPMQLWTLNTPTATAPYPWNYSRVTTPTMYLLVGRLEFPEQSRLHWPNPELLIQAQAEALGWPVETLDACGPLQFFLEQVDDEPESMEDPLLEMAFSVAAAAKKRIEDEHIAAKDCRVILEFGPASMIHVYLQPRHQHKNLLCSMKYEEVIETRTQIADKLKQVLEDFGFPVVWSGPADGDAAMLH
ncbi:hypothetical protein HF925_08630 [Acidithiobacillus ferriphilus]|uniref:hypothetical protein n=1 Tax=Acidithiobacillus ferriphilus TaxID=1689834 RepID=UPI001C070C84|nr:hypothetical protein [Acidithiobacillus ferriphilus]MBU2848642.1 hypothetical protein [Acidithiobacillus ferriphilus]